MIKQITINIVFLAFGVIFGAYLPLAVIYLVSFFRRSGFTVIWKTAVRIALIALLLFLIAAAFAVTGVLLGAEQLSDELFNEACLFMALGIVGSFLAGILLFVMGLARGRSRTVTGRAA
jgi:hypothetical protein